MCSRPTYVFTKKIRKLAIRGQNCRLFIVASVDALVKAQSQTAVQVIRHRCAIRVDVTKVLHLQKMDN